MEKAIGRIRMGERSYSIGMFTPGDAGGVTRLFREVYGDGYPLPIVYEPDKLVAAFQAGEYIPIIAATPDNRVVGFTALYRPAPHKGLFEAGMSLVAPDYRNTPIFGLMARHAVRVAPAIHGIEALMVQGVCNHTHTQRAGAMLKHIETALEVDLMPARAYENEGAALGRIAALDLCRTFVPKPHDVSVPAAYEGFFRFIYGGFDDRRMVRPSKEVILPGRSTEMATRIFDGARVARVTVYEAGTEFAAVFDAEEGRARDGGCVVIQVVLRPAWPWIGAVVDVMRMKGFFLGGILPRWFDEDGFLMQKVLGPPNWEGIDLYTDRAKELLRFVRDDWEDTRRNGPVDLEVGAG
jgi:hypothetical protein